jgi:hypothetical protein
LNAVRAERPAAGTRLVRRALAMERRGNWPRLPLVGQVSRFRRVAYMLKHIILAVSLTCGTAAYAQPQQATSPPPPGAATSPLPAPAATVDTRKLIGRKIQDAQNETIGQITSIYIGPDGHVDSVMVGVGGFLGVGEREVRIAWSDLRVENYGEKVMVNMTKDELKARPEYRYGDTSWRGQVFSDKGPLTAADPNRSASAADRNMATTSTGDFNSADEMSRRHHRRNRPERESRDGGQGPGHLCRRRRGHQEGRGLGRRLPRHGCEGCRGELERHQVLARRHVPGPDDDLDQGLAEGDAGLQIRTACAGNEVRRLIANVKQDGRVAVDARRHAAGLPFGRLPFWGATQVSLAQSCGKTRGQETVCGAVGYRISLSASQSSGIACSTLACLRASSGRQEGSGTAGSWPGREAADPIVIPYLR